MKVWIVECISMMASNDTCWWIDKTFDSEQKANNYVDNKLENEVGEEFNWMITEIEVE